MLSNFKFFSLVILILCSTSQIYVNDDVDKVDHYLNYLNALSPTSNLGNFEAEKLYYQEFLNKGYSRADAYLFSHMGIVHEDPYMVWLRDPVLYINNMLPKKASKLGLTQLSSFYPLCLLFLQKGFF